MWDEIIVYKHILSILRNEYPILEDLGMCRLNGAYRNNIWRAGKTLDMVKHVEEIEQVQQEFKINFGKNFLKYSTGIRSKFDSFMLIFLPIKIL